MLLHGLSTKEKCQIINQNPKIYGSFAEIGAGQEVARSFFRVAGASATVAKTMSAYDMTFSDLIYGAEPSKRYVCESRLKKMLIHEFDLLTDRLGRPRGKDSAFFAFANTVAARSRKSRSQCHGWMGLRFQQSPESEFSEIIVHVRMLDQRNFLQQEALGIVGVNLIYGAYYLSKDPLDLIDSLVDGLDLGRIEIDCVHLSGPLFSKTDRRVIGFHLVENQLSKNVFITESGNTDLAGDQLYGKPVLTLSGSFAPLTLLHEDMIKAARSLIQTKFKISEPHVVLDINVSKLVGPQKCADIYFLDRIKLLGELGFSVQLSRYEHHFELMEHITKCTQEKVFLLVGIGHLAPMFDAAHLDNLDGGVLEGLGKLTSGNSHILCYPANSLDVEQPVAKDQKTNCFTLKSFPVPSSFKGALSDLVSEDKFIDLEGSDDKLLRISSKEVLEQIRSREAAWTDKVSKNVKGIIESQHLFGWRP
ncbi:MAG: nicotinate-nucleotide adenylyltransferase [Bdellovibrionales bacterium CG10_big_fil_rev_8_21_14_0_10_45_34]|nr:MAG: nicotinate-nucleotide adenylyltransferase [Bdellovibrionales bacterium CG10_big_fil_rev_8_21_14_0_10_45_34]